MNYWNYFRHTTPPRSQHATLFPGSLYCSVGEVRKITDPGNEVVYHVHFCGPYLRQRRGGAWRWWWGLLLITKSVFSSYPLLLCIKLCSISTKMVMTMAMAMACYNGSSFLLSLSNTKDLQLHSISLTRIHTEVNCTKQLQGR